MRESVKKNKYVISSKLFQLVKFKMMLSVAAKMEINLIVENHKLDWVIAPSFLLTEDRGYIPHILFSY